MNYYYYEPPFLTLKHIFSLSLLSHTGGMHSFPLNQLKIIVSVVSSRIPQNACIPRSRFGHTPVPNVRIYDVIQTGGYSG